MLPMPSRLIVSSRLVAVDRSLDGARILWRHFLSTTPAKEGWVKEFTRDGSRVRIAKTDKPADAGLWHRAYDLVCEGVLDAAKAPTPPADAEPPDVSSYLDGGDA
jgi:hypothetical protein